MQRDGVGCEPLEGKKKVSFRSRAAEPTVSSYGLPRYHGKGLDGAQEVTEHSVTGVVPRIL